MLVPQGTSFSFGYLKQPSSSLYLNYITYAVLIKYFNFSFLTYWSHVSEITFKWENIALQLWWSSQAAVTWDALCCCCYKKKTGLCVDTVGEQTITLNCTCRQRGDLTQHHSLAISDLCNTSLPHGQNHGFASHSPEELEEEETSSVALDSSSHCLQLPHCNM